MAKHLYKKGDLVVCMMPRRGVTKGRVYTVQNDNELTTDLVHITNDNGRNQGLYPKRFRLAYKYSNEEEI
jgi:hypothetical protein